MRIILLNDDSLPTARGGAAVIVENLRLAYIKEGHDVTLITTHQDDSRDPIERADGVISIFAKYPLAKRHRMCLGYPQMRDALSMLFEELQPDVIHAHNIHTYLTYESLLLARKHTEKIFLTAHDTFLVSFGRVRGLRYKRSVTRGKPYKLNMVDHLLAAGRKYYPPRNKRIKNILHASNTQVIAISNAVAKLLITHNIASRTIPNGIAPWKVPTDADIQAFKTKHNIQGPTVLFCGRIRKDKGIDCLLAAMQIVQKEIPDAKLVVNGDDKDISSQEGVIATGWLDRDQTRLSYFVADIVTTPSIYLDNFPTVNLEAAAAGKPVVGTIFGGTPEVVNDGETGILVNPHNTKQFAEALVSLLKDPQKAEEMGKIAQKLIREQFSLEKQVNTYLKLFQHSTV